MSLVHNMENARRRVWRERIVADFRDFRFSWQGFLRWMGIVIAAILFAAVVTLYFLDWNQMRGPIARYASARSGHPVRIDGDLKVDLFRLDPHVSVDGLFVGNPPGNAAWSGRLQAARLKHAEFAFRLFPALAGHWLLPLVRIDGGEILVVRDREGRTNWDSASSGAAASWSLPPIQRFLVKDGRVEIDDALRKLKFLGTIASQENTGAGGGAFVLSGNGTLNGNTFVADVHGGALLNIDQSKPYAFNADIHAGDTHALLPCAISHPFRSQTVQRPGAIFRQQFGRPLLPDRPGAARHAALSPGRHAAGATASFYSFTGVTGVVGHSDLHGYLTVDVSGRLPDLRGHLSSRVLDFDDLGALFRGGKVAAAQDQWLLPDIALHTEKLRELNGELDYEADAIASRDFPLRGLSTHISVENSVLTLKPLAFSFTEGKLSGALTIDARKDVPVTGVDARITDLHIEHFIKSTDKPVSGMVEARAKLSGSGNSVHKVAASADGMATLVMPSGQIKRSVAAWLGVNVIDALGLTLSGDRSNTNVRCAVAGFTARQGTLHAERFVLDTDPVRVDGQGTVNLKDETVDLTLQGKPKSFQLLRLKAPITVSGMLESPKLGVDARPVVTQAAIGVGLSLLSPLASLLAFIDPGLAKDANCAGLLSDAQSQGAPVKNSAVNKAAASDATKARK